MGKGGNTKNLRYPNQQLINDLFEDTNMPSVDDLENVYDLDLDLINQESNILATGTISNLLLLYNNKQFTEEHPEFRKRIDAEIESLRKYFKMAKTNEQVHDHLALAIASNPNNASLYTSLTRIQAVMIQIDDKIKATMNEFNKLCTSYQTEINFQIDSQNTGDTHEDKDGGITSRGSKAFIEEMNNAEEATEEVLDENNLFVDSDEEEEITEE